MEILIFLVLIAFGLLVFTVAVGTSDRDLLVTRDRLRSARHHDKV